MRVLFFGTAEFAVPSLAKLAASAMHEVIGVVTQPDKPQGRGRHVSSSPVKREAAKLGLPILQPKRVRAESFLEKVGEMGPDAIALAAFGQIIPQALLDLPQKGPINVHGSLLPKYRGAAPIQRAILNGETVTGITTMWMDASLDTGDILLTKEVVIEVDDTTGTLTPRMADAGADLLIETLDRLERDACPRIPQIDADATYAPPITAADSVIRWTESAAQIRNRVRAMSPKPGAFATFGGRRIKIWSAVASEAASIGAGVIADVTRDAVIVGASDAVVELREVQPENGRRMSASDWARGARLHRGHAFTSEV